VFVAKIAWLGARPSRSAQSRRLTSASS
jgi:hypothetical protein